MRCCNSGYLTNWSDYRSGRFSTDIGETEQPPIATDIAQRLNRRQASRHKAFRHYRWESSPPIMTDTAIIIGGGCLYRHPTDNGKRNRL